MSKFSAEFKAKEQKPYFVEPCSFCWFVMSIYPTPPKDMSEKDKACFSIHLKREHGLQPEITP